MAKPHIPQEELIKVLRIFPQQFSLSIPELIAKAKAYARCQMALTADIFRNIAGALQSDLCLPFLRYEMLDVKRQILDVKCQMTNVKYQMTDYR